MIILGLTGSIGMGKSTAASMLRRLGIPVQDSDAVVHGLLAPGGAAVTPVLAAFPGVGTTLGGIDRQALGRQVFGNDLCLRRLERILHPLVQQAKDAKLAQWARRREKLVVLDVPLLFETGGDKNCDAVLVVSAPAFLQQQRVLARPGMTRAKFEAIRRKQVPDRVKRQLSRYIVETGLGRRYTWLRLRKFLREIRARFPLGSSVYHARNLSRYGNHGSRSLNRRSSR